MPFFKKKNYKDAKKTSTLFGRGKNGRYQIQTQKTTTEKKKKNKQINKNKTLT